MRRVFSIYEMNGLTGYMSNQAENIRRRRTSLTQWLPVREEIYWAT